MSEVVEVAFEIDGKSWNQWVVSMRCVGGNLEFHLEAAFLILARKEESKEDSVEFAARKLMIQKPMDWKGPKMCKSSMAFKKW